MWGPDTEVNPGDSVLCDSEPFPQTPAMASPTCVHRESYRCALGNFLFGKMIAAFCPEVGKRKVRREKMQACALQVWLAEDKVNLDLPLGISVHLGKGQKAHCDAVYLGGASQMALFQ